MVKIAIVGGSGNVGQEIIDALVARKKHEILLLSRKDAAPGSTVPGVTWVKANYQDPEHLTQILLGVDTLLSFVSVSTDPGNVTQKNLIQAAIRAGVRRFAPSEWASSQNEEHMPWYHPKLEMREYLKELNKNGKASSVEELEAKINGPGNTADTREQVLEYTLFQPGLFVNYLTHPHQSSKHVHAMQTPIDFGNCRALVVEGSDDAPVSLITSDDLAEFVARAIEYEGEWPVVGGIKADELTLGQIIQLGERVRGSPFNVERLKPDDLKASVVKSSWLPKIDHPSLTPEEVETLAAPMTAGIVLGLSAGAFSVSDEWNRLIPDFEFTKAEEFLTDFWQGKP